MDYSKKSSLPTPKKLVVGLLALVGTVAASDVLALCLPSSPLQQMVVTSNWGKRMRPNARLPGNQPWWRAHNGFDLTTNRQDKPLFAPMDGMITAASFESSQGNHIDIEGTGATAGIKTVSMHLSAMHVKPGQMVKAGQQIGLTGETGAGIAGAPHLHFEVRINNGKTPQDPRGYFCPTPSARGNLSDTYDLVTGELVPKVYPGVGSGATTSMPGGAPTNSPPPQPGKSIAPGGGIPPQAPFPLYSGRSLANFFAQEVESRFLNTTWMTQLIDPLYTWRTDPQNAGKTPPPVGDPQPMLVREIAIMLGVSNAIRLETDEIRRHTESMMSAILAMQVRDYSNSIVRMVQETTASTR